MNPSNFNLPTIQELIYSANADRDAASVFVLGNNWDSACGCIVVVKGRPEAVKMKSLLVQAELSTLNPVRVVKIKEWK